MVECRVVEMVAWILFHSNVELMCRVSATRKLVVRKVLNLLQAKPETVIQAAKSISVLLPAPAERGGTAVESPQNDRPPVARSTVFNTDVCAHITKHDHFIFSSWVNAIVATGLQAVLIKLLAATTGWRNHKN